MKKKIIISIVTIVIVAGILILTCHYIRYHKLSSNIEVMQVNLITRDNLEKICLNNQPIIIEKFPIEPSYKFSLARDVECSLVTDFPSLVPKRKFKLKNIILKYPNLKGSIVENKGITNIVDDRFLEVLGQYHSPINFGINHSVSIIDKNLNRHLTSHNMSRNIYIIVDGECEFHLYHPDNTKGISKLNNNHPYYEISFYGEKNVKFGNYEYTKFILRKGQGIIIPRHWMFTYFTNSHCIILNSVSGDIVSWATNLKKTLYNSLYK